jgi:HEAT repeat protein
MGYGLRPEEDAEILSSDVGKLLVASIAPRQINKILRIAAELQLKPLAPAVMPLADSPSGLIRASAARAIGALADPEEGKPVLERLEQDPVEDVRKVAASARREIESPAADASAEMEEEETLALDEGARLALQELLSRMERSGD